MLTITIHQPYASLVCLGIKDIENRTWKLPEKYKGKRVLIHAGLAKAKFNFTTPQIKELNKRNLRRWYDREQIKGAIIGSVEIVDCVINHPSIWAEKTNFMRGDIPVFNWVLANPILFNKPIRNVSGQQRFWDYPFPTPEPDGIHRNYNT